MLSNAKKLWLMKIGRGIGPSPSMSPSMSASASPSSSPSASPSPSIIFDSTGSTFDRGDFTADNAFFWSSLDLSPYEGTDLGSTPYYIEVLDGAGKKATGYIGAVGAGETLGSELVTAWTNDSFDTWVTSGGNITDARTLVAGRTAHSNTLGQLIGALYYLNSNLTVVAGSLPSYYLATPYTDGGEFNYATLPSGITTKYYTFKTPTHDVIALVGNGVADQFSLTNSIKRVTDPPATAVHIVSSLNGTTRDWASIESGFDPNDIASWTIWGF